MGRREGEGDRVLVATRPISKRECCDRGELVAEEGVCTERRDREEWGEGVQCCAMRVSERRRRRRREEREWNVRGGRRRRQWVNGRETHATRVVTLLCRKCIH